MLYSKLFKIIIQFLFSVYVNGVRNHDSVHILEDHDSFMPKITNEFQIVHPEHITYRTENLMDENNVTIYHMIQSVTPILIKNDDVVTVSFESNAPNYKDWIAAYSPASLLNSLNTTTPVKYGWCDESLGYTTTGNGSLTFNLTNLRDDVVFVYYSGSTYYPVFLNSSSEIVSFENPNEPLRPRVVATGDVNIFTVLWSSATSTQPQLKWGTTSGSYPNVIDAVTTTIEQSQMCGSPAADVGWRDVGLIHHANMTGMVDLANTKLYYIYGDEATSDYSNETEFYAPPLAGQQPPASKNRGTRVIIYDDFGRGSSDDTFTWRHYGDPAINTTMAVAYEIEQGTVDAIYHGGDISYATGYIAVWDFFMDMIAPMAGSVIYLTTVGNHESDWPDTATLYPTSTDSGGECGILATEMIPMPAPATTDEPWWSYDVGLIHFVGMSSEHDYSLGSKQNEWLKNDLESVNRTLTPWIIFGGHRPMYINSDYSGNDESDVTVSQDLVDNIEQMLYDNNVNVAFWGHNHVVQRQTAVKNYEVVQYSSVVIDENGNEVHHHEDPQATVHMVVGTGGARFTVNYVSPYPEWCEMVFYRWGYARVEAVNATYLTWDWVQSNDGEVLDRMSITQSGNKWISDDNTSQQGLSDGGKIAVYTTGSLMVILIVFLMLRNSDCKYYIRGWGLYHTQGQEDMSVLVNSTSELSSDAAADREDALELHNISTSTEIQNQNTSNTTKNNVTGKKTKKTKHSKSYEIADKEGVVGL